MVIIMVHSTPDASSWPHRLSVFGNFQLLCAFGPVGFYWVMAAYTLDVAKAACFALSDWRIDLIAGTHGCFHTWSGDLMNTTQTLLLIVKAVNFRHVAAMAVRYWNKHVHYIFVKELDTTSIFLFSLLGGKSLRKYNNQKYTRLYYKKSTAGKSSAH